MALSASASSHPTSSHTEGFDVPDTANDDEKPVAAAAEVDTNQPVDVPEGDSLSPGKAKEQRVERPGMRRGATAPTERAGVYRVGLTVAEELRWIWREQSTDDYGIDGHIELVDDEEFVTGRLIGVQVKSGDSYLKEVERSKTEPGWNYWADSNHLAYWLGHCLPVLVSFVDSNHKAYWQVVTTDTVNETAKGFTIWVPDTNRLDSTAKEALRTFAASWRSLNASLPDNYRELPPAAVKALKRAEDVDGFAVSRLAGILASGSSDPKFTAQSVLSSSPTWLSGSPAAEDLWLSVAAFSNEHNHGRVASKAYGKAAAANGPRHARALAFAGLSVVAESREDARPFLEQAIEAGEEVLAAVGLSMIDVPVDDARAIPIPPVIASADQNEIDKDPTVLNFLAEMALRNQDTAKAVEYREKAVTASAEPGGSLNLALASTLWRQVREVGDRNTSTRRRAIALVQETIEARRQWHGPSAEALELLLDIFNTAGMFMESITAALPDTLGGTALANEGTHGVARRGALAAQAVQDKSIAAYFKEILGSTPERAELEALEHDVPPASRDERIQRWSDLLKEAPDDQMRSRIIARLVRLGVWPKEADDMESRSVLPPHQAETFRAIYQANDPSQDQHLGLSKLRDLARKSSLAAYELVSHLESTADPARAISASEEVTRHWGDTVLAEQLVELHWRLGDPDRAVALVSEHVREDAFAPGARTAMTSRAAIYLVQTGKYDDAVTLARAGLAISDDDDLAWTLVGSLHALGRIPEARTELDRLQPRPTTEQERRLWVELHLGNRLEVPDAWTLLELIRQQPPGQLRTDMASLLIREVLQDTTPDGVTYPVNLIAATRELQDDESLGTKEAQLGNDALLRERVVRPLTSSGDYRKMLAAYLAGTQPLADVAEAINQPWGTAVLQRPAGFHVISDLTPGLRAVGRQAARRALEEHRCVIDLTALYTMTLLRDDDRIRIRGELAALTLPASFARDVGRTRAQVRAIITADKTLGVNSAGHSAWITPSLKERAELMRAADLLEQQTASASTAITPPAPPYDQLAVLAQETLSVVWCDDNAGRQVLRARGVATFSTLDLLDVFPTHVRQLQPQEVYQHLGLHQAVDLPLSGGLVAALGISHGWGTADQRTPVQAVLLRAAWWSVKNRQPQADAPQEAEESGQHWAASWEDDWSIIAEAAAACSPGDLTSITRAAVHGLRASVATGLQQQRHLQLLVRALKASHAAGTAPEPNFLDQVAAVVPPATAPDPRVVRVALTNHLRSAGVDGPEEVAIRLLPRVPL